MVSEEALKKLQEQIAAWPMTQRFVVQQLIEVYSNIRKDLLAYKNTGLTPEQCENAKAIIESAFSDDTSKAERIRELLKADKDGRLVVLPCKVGGEVYSTLDDLGQLHQCRVTRVHLDERTYLNTVVLEPVDYEGSQYGAAFGAFGKTIFLTREEAEEALGAMKK